VSERPTCGETEVNAEIPDWMIIDAVRYCMGRQSYQVGITCEWLRRNWRSMSDHTRTIVQRDVEEEFERDDRDRELGRPYKALGLIPLPWKLGIVAVAVALVGVSGYVKGRNSLKADMQALRQGYEVASAQAAGREAERVRVWTNAAVVAGEKFNERAKVADASFDSNLDRLRRAYNSHSARLRPPASAAGSCPEPSGPTAGELLKAGEMVAGLVREADRDRAALMACVSAWPR